jgi:hypothetical protein
MVAGRPAGGMWLEARRAGGQRERCTATRSPPDWRRLTIHVPVAALQTVEGHAVVYDAHHIRERSSGDTVARAKRTDRAEARRRYRAALDPALEGDQTEPAEAAPTRQHTAGRPVVNEVRMGIVAALKASFHPLNVREDIAALPSLVRNKAFWIPLLVTIASTAAVIATNGRDAITAILFSYFVQTPAIGGVFLAGFLAPRASWLLGAIIGLVAAGGYIAVLGLIPGALSTTDPGGATIGSIGFSALLLSPLMGAFFAATAAWYRRFLTLTNPNRARRAQAAAQKRAGDGRSRTTVQRQKAPARR